MKRLLLYIVLPGVILGIVYQFGRSAGSRQQVEVPTVSSSQSVLSAEEKSALVDAKLSALSEKLSQLRRSSQTRSPSPDRQSAESLRKPVSKPVSVPLIRTSEEVPQRDNDRADISEPARSVYDRLPAGSKPSDMGLMPLQPLGEAAVYPGVQPVSRTTFKEPVPLALPSGSASARSVSPIRITSSVTCDCETGH